MFETGVCWSRRLRRCRTHSIMPFGLIIGTDRASALQVCLGPALLLFFVELNFFFVQKSIQDELTARSFSPDAGERPVLSTARSSTLTPGTDPVMAEYITIMIINNKTAGM